MSGTASFVQQGNLLQITNSPNAIIHWQSFSIGANEITRFIQQSAASAVLNRVVGQDPSAILGALESNGRVFLINPNGIVFGAGAQINVAGLVASTLNLSNEDFLNNRLRFTEGALGGSVVNQGSLTGGSVYLVGKAVTNDGLITSPNGEVVLAAGKSVELVNPGTPNLRVEVVAPDNEARNLGTITAEAGRIGIYAGLIHNAGMLNASSAVAEGGRIMLRAIHRVEAGGAISANGVTGGNAQLLGKQVGVMDGATVTADGTQGGGMILVGGDYQGANPDVPNAEITYIAPTARLSADALQSGNGGRIIAWADDTTRAYGSFSARGGANSGNGGFIETSGKQYLDVAGARINTTAPQGEVGIWLLDPTDITIVHGAASGGASFGSSPPGLFNSGGGATATLNDFDINSNLATTNVTITTASVANNSGNITFDASAGAGGSIVITNGSGGTRNLILNADNDIIFSGGSTTFQTTAAGALGVNFNPGAGRKVNVLSGSTAVFNGFNSSGYVAAYISGASGKTWENAGTVTLSGVSYIDLNNGVTSTFNNNAGGVLNLNSTQGWAIQSTSASQAEPINNAGTINVNTGTSIEALYNQSSTGVLNIAAGKFLSIQNGQTINGTVNIAAGGTLWVSEYHTSETLFSGTKINGSGTVQVLGSSPVAKFTNVDASGVTLKLGSGGTVRIQDGTSIFGALDAAAYGSGLYLNNGTLALSAGHLMVPANVNYSGNAGYQAKGGDIVVSSSMSSGGSINLEATGDVKVLGGGNVSAGTVKLKGANVEIGGSAAASPATVLGNSSLEITANGALKVQGGSGAGAYANVSSSGTMKVTTGGDVLLNGGSGSNAWAQISGNPDVELSVGGVVRLNAGSGSGAYSRIAASQPSTIYLTLANLTSGGYFVNGVENAVFDSATQTGFFANGAPAVLGQSLVVTYGGALQTSAPSLEAPNEQTQIALNELSKLGQNQGESGPAPGPDEEERKKELPICR